MFTPISTQRLLLREFTPADAAAMFEYASDLDTVRYMGWPRHCSLEDSQAIATMMSSAKPGERGWGVAIVDKASGRLLGSTGVNLDDDEVAITGWILRREAQGKGFATEAMREMLKWAWTAFPKLRRIDASIYHQNLASLALARKIGMRENGVYELGMPNLGPGNFELKVYSAFR